MGTKNALSKPAWTDRVRLSQAAAMIGVSFRFLRGWYERGLIETSGTDDSRPGHPHLITLGEVARLAVAVQVHRLSTVGRNAKWNPGSFLGPFREMFPDAKLQHLPQGPLRSRAIGWRDSAYVKRMDAEASQRADDLLLVISKFQNEPTGEPQIFTEVTLGEFLRTASVFVVTETAWSLINVSNVVRQVLEGRDRVLRRR